MATRTPKSTITIKDSSLSPTRKQISQSNTNAKLSGSFYSRSANKPQIQDTAQYSLISKMIQNQISSEQSYQNLLIHNKQLQLKILQLQEQSQQLKKTFKRANKPLQEIKEKIEGARLSLVEKQKYLEKFYVHLDKKLKSNVQANLFAKLERIEITLQQKYQLQKEELYASLAAQHQKMEAANEELNRLKEYRDELIKEYTQRAMQSSSNRVDSEKKSNRNQSQRKSNHSKLSLQKKSTKSQAKESLKNKEQNALKKRKQQKIQGKLENRRQCDHLQENIQKLRKQKQIVEKDEKILKILLNIDQEHKKHATYIINGYKKMFTIKYRDLLCKRKTLSVTQKSSQMVSVVGALMPDVEGLQKQLSLKVAERKILEKEILERNLGLEKCKEKLNEEIGQYSMLQEQIMEVGNKNLSGSNNNNRNMLNNYNSRSTYHANQSPGTNHRSTYTSYQKNSQVYDEDL